MFRDCGFYVDVQEDCTVDPNWLYQMAGINKPSVKLPDSSGEKKYKMRLPKPSEIRFKLPDDSGDRIYYSELPDDSGN